MHCPRCGQPQVSNEVRFCSRCGFRLDIVTELLKNDGALVPQTGAPSQSAMRRRRTRQGAKLMFISAFLMPFALALSIATDSPGPLIIPPTVFLMGLFWLLYFRFFGEEDNALSESLYRPPQMMGAAR